MVANRADLGCGNADDNVSAVAAFPDGYAGFFKHRFRFHIFQKCAVSFLVRLFNSGNSTELCGKSVKAFFLRLAGHSFVHVGPLCVLTFSGMEQVFCRVAKLAQCLEVGKAPEVTFALADEKPVAAYAYCNLHGLWKSEI